MATSKIVQPLLNPVKFVDIDPVIVPEYLSRHMDLFFYMETLRQWQTKKKYIQTWQNSDLVSLQFHSTLNPVKFSVIDIDEVVYSSTLLDVGLYNFDEPDLSTYHVNQGLSGFSPGLYFFRVDFGVPSNGNYPLTLISEPQHIAPVQKNTLLLSFTHPVYKDDVFFGQGFNPTIRIGATLRLKSLASKDTFFEDQPLNMTLLQSKPYRVYQLLIGGSTGIPDYLADIVNRVLGCKNLLIDGQPYTKADGAKLEDNAQENYPLRGWSIDMREAENVVSLVYQPGTGNRVVREDGSFILREDGSFFLREAS